MSITVKHVSKRFGTFVALNDVSLEVPTGALLALGNVEPERCVAAFAGDATAQREITDRHLAAGRGGVPALKRILAEDRGRPVPVRVG